MADRDRTAKKPGKTLMKPRKACVNGGSRKGKSVIEQINIYESMIQHSAVAIFVADIKHRIIHWNRACEELTGIRAEDVLGTKDHWKAFYKKKRSCLLDFIIDGNEEEMEGKYPVYGSSVLMPYSLHAEGWYEHVGGRKRYLIFDAAPVFNHEHKLVAAIETLQDLTEQKLLDEERQRLNLKLQEALDKIKTLTGLIPMCASCKKIRDDKGYWNQLEEYLEKHSDASFSHGLCPECFKEYFNDDDKKKKE